MITTKTFDAPLTFDQLDDVGKRYPVIYVFFKWDGLDAALCELFSSAEPGEIAIIAPFDAQGDYCRRFGLVSPRCMIAFSLDAPYAGATDVGGYAEAIAGARRHRWNDKKAESRLWPNAPWSAPEAASEPTED